MYMKINTDITKRIISRKNVTLYINKREQIEQVTNLSTIIAKNGEIGREINEHIRKMERIFYFFNLFIHFQQYFVKS